MDYVWICFGLLGLFPAISESRQFFARGQLNWADVRLIGSFERIRGDVDLFSSSGILCRKFVRSDLSPPAETFEKIQKEHDEACDWFIKLSETFPKSLKDVKSKIDLKKFPPIPVVTDAIVTNNINRFQSAVENFNGVYDAKTRLDQQSKRSDIEMVVISFAPIFLALAFALRITKVTGEIRLDREAERQKARTELTPE